MSKRVGILKDGFYNSLNEKGHYYDAFDNSYLDSLDFDFKAAQHENCMQDADLDSNKPICIAFDYNANINWIVAGQQQGLKMLTLKSFYVKYDRKLRELVQDFCRYYDRHNTKEAVYYYDNTALGSNYAVGNDDFASIIIEEFERLGWSVERKHIGNPVRHSDKYLWISKALKGERFLFPMFNRSNNEALLLAMEQTGTRYSSKGFMKDKSGEKLIESEEDLLEYRTDGTDAWDTLFIGMNKFPADSSPFGMTSHFG
jgi:glycosyltransferase involved in cell wall biosynthesis